MVNKFLYKRAVKADVFNADFFKVPIGTHLPVIRMINTGMQGFIEANPITLNFGNAMFFTYANPTIENLAPESVGRTRGKKLINCFKGVVIHSDLDPLTGFEPRSVSDCDPE